jgi:hypothetical protein
MGFALDTALKGGLSTLESTIKSTYMPKADVTSAYASIEFVKSFVTAQLVKVNSCDLKGLSYNPSTDSCAVTSCSEVEEDGVYLINAGGLSFKGYCQMGSDGKFYLVMQV